jgi:tetratricopeptide (TPR) repeat protein
VHQTIDDECRIDGSEADGSELVIKLQEKVLGIKHPDTLRTYFNLARCLKAEGKTDEARQFAQRAAEVAAKFLGENHPDTLKYQKLAQELQKN